MSPIVLPSGYQYVIGALGLTQWLLGYQTYVVTKARIRAKVAYPQAYAELSQTAASPDAQKFNCAQRAHQNTLEAMPILLIATPIAGLTYPVAAAVLCGLWSLARVAYTNAYSTGDPAKRSIPFRLSTFFLAGLAVMSTYNAVRFILEL